MVSIEITDSLSKIWQNTTNYSKQKEGICLINEHFSFQIVICSDKSTDINFKLKYDKVSLECQSFLEKEIKGVLPNRYKKDDYIEDIEEKYYPDLLLNTPENLYLEPNINTIIWVDVFAKQATDNKSIIVSLLDNNVIIEKEFIINIIDCKLEKNDLMITHWMHYDCLKHSYKTELFSNAFYKIFNNILLEYVKFGNTMLLIPLFTPPLDTKIGNERDTAQLVIVKLINRKYVFDFTKLKKFMFFCQERGIKYFEMSHLSTQWGAKFCPKVMANVDGIEKRIFGWENSSTSTEYLDFISQFLDELVVFLIENKFIDKSFLHISDEPKITDIEQYKKISCIINKHKGKLQHIDALSEYSFSKDDIVDLPAVSTLKTDEFLNNNKKIMVYYCGSMLFDYVSGRAFMMPRQRNRILGIQLYLNNVV